MGDSTSLAFWFALMPARTDSPVGSKAGVASTKRTIGFLSDYMVYKSIYGKTILHIGG
jgi:hypothetical protein